MIKIIVNKEALEVEEGTTLHTVLEKILEEQNGVAVALNETIVAKDNWHATTLHNNDEIIIIGAVAGG